jgi:Mrp family chromosome partitioning ATPase
MTLSPPAFAENIIAVASGKGGVGKTWFSITLAHLFARDLPIGLAVAASTVGLVWPLARWWLAWMRDGGSPTGR